MAVVGGWQSILNQLFCNNSPEGPVSFGAKSQTIVLIIVHDKRITKMPIKVLLIKLKPAALFLPLPISVIIKKPAQSIINIAT
ncbi:MAG: hypothetical protein KO464_01090 [Candidatus Methanofastidiosum sp.]|nr:hypothetical protein [Methanofastidiosum sp.]